MKQSRNKKGQYRHNYLPKLLLLLIIVAVGAGVYTGDITANTTEVFITPIVEKVAKDDIGNKLDDTRKMVEAGITAKEQVNEDNLLVERANQAYKDAVAIQNASVEEYNLTLEAMELYGGGAIEIFFEVAGERNLLK